MDLVRQAVWNDERVATWYAQNTILYCPQQRVEASGVLSTARALTRDDQLAIVHPRQFEHYARPDALTLLKLAPSALRRSLTRGLKGNAR